MHTHTGISTVRETRSDAHYAAFVYGTRDTQPRTTMWPIANPSSATDNRSFILAAIAVAFVAYMQLHFFGRPLLLCLIRVACNMPSRAIKAMPQLMQCNVRVCVCVCVACIRSGGVSVCLDIFLRKFCHPSNTHTHTHSHTHTHKRNTLTHTPSVFVIYALTHRWTHTHRWDCE